ncbi:hypothetical protein B566_EDAN005405 [Ephemera danica]|nr:hypothetical protein B566_EDAN005405 [Ephemera danica]
MKDRNLVICYGVLLLFASLPWTAWCIRGPLALDTSVSAATSLAAKLSHTDPLPATKHLESSTKNVSSSSEATKLPGASVVANLQDPPSSVHEQRSSNEKLPDVPETSEGARVEELHSSFDEVSAEVTQPEPPPSPVESQESPSLPQLDADLPSTSADVLAGGLLGSVGRRSTIATPHPRRLKVFVSSEPSLADPLNLVSISSLPSTTSPPATTKNESLTTQEKLDSEVTNETDKGAPRVVSKKEGVSDATLPPDLTPKAGQLPTSTPTALEDSTGQAAVNTAGDVAKTQPESTVKPDTLPETVVLETPLVPPSPSNASEEAEEIPSFNEWAQKKLADAEKRKVQNASETPKATPKPSGNVKLRSKNYASPDCGAKILAANPEAQSVSSVLSPSRDEYALNPCTSSKIWFVVELCEAIQAKQVELANFELFSSSPKDFSVWASDRFPTREWHQLGQFTAQDERNVQIFSLSSNIFGKFLKVEMHSHWGSEHFCPVSLLRVYGTSEFEVLDTDYEGQGARTQDDDDGVDDLTTVPGGDTPKSLMGSARDAVISIVQKAAQVLGKSGDSRNKTEVDSSPTLETSCGMSPLSGQECPQCSPAVQQILTCQADVLHSLLASRFVLRSLQHEQLCAEPEKAHNDSYLAALLPAEYLSALCHLLLALHQPRSTTSAPSYDNLTLGQSQDPFLLLQPSETTTCGQQEASAAVTPKPEQQLSSQAEASVPPSSSSLPVSASDVASQIRPTRTLKEREMSVESSASAPVVATMLPDVPAPPSPPSGSTLPAENSTMMVHTEAVATVEENSHIMDTEHTTKTLEEWPLAEPLDTLLADLKEEVVDLEQAVHTTPTSPEPETEANIPTPPPAAHSPTGASPSVPQQGGQQKESVLVRLANRVKVVERNLSLSSQYLEEISKRYKRQMEEMQKAYERTLTAIGESARQAIQREQAQAEHISNLEQRLSALASTTAALLAERDSWHYKVTVVSQHFILMAVLLYLIISLVRQCSPSSAYKEPTPEPIVVPPLRRHSIDQLRLNSGSRQRKRRPSEEIVPCDQKRLIRLDSMGGDPSKKKRRKLRQQLRGVSVEDLCSGLSPATLAAVRLPLYRHPLTKPRLVASPKSRRFSTESAPLLKGLWPTVSVTQDEPKVNGIADQQVPVEVHQDIQQLSNSSPASPTQQQKKQSGLRKMVRKLF